jgi:anti-sigma regulatory factor (Ser/Thr protein kinase)
MVVAMVEFAAPTASDDMIAYSDPAHLPLVRAFVRSRARALGLAPERAELLTLAVSELATNTLQHTSGPGQVRLWVDVGRLTCDVEDTGPARPLGRLMPPADAEGGRGLAIVERVCDEVTTMAGARGTLVRLRFAL